MLRLLGFAFTLMMAVFVATGTARADCQFSVGQYVDVSGGADGTWKPGVVIKVLDDLDCGYTVRVLKQPGDDMTDFYAASYFDFLLRPHQGPLPYDKPYGCPYAPNDNVDVLSDDDGQWHRGSVVSTDEDCSFSVALYSATNELDSDSAQPVAGDHLRPSQLATPSDQDIASAKAAGLCKSGETAADSAGSDPDSQMKHGVAADLDKRTSAINHLTFENIQAGRTSVIADGGTFATDHPDAVIGDSMRPYRITVSVCTDGQAQLRPLHFSFDYACYANAFGEGICEQTAARQLH